MEKAWSLALWSVLVCRIAIITDNSKGDGTGTIPRQKGRSKWGFTGKVETRSYERLVDALIDFVETGDGLKARFLTGFAACLAADRKSVENRGFGVAVRKVRCHRGEDGTVRVSSVETMHERRYTVDDWRYDTADCEQTENGQKS